MNRNEILKKAHSGDLSGADLSGADLYEADLSRANLSRADLSRANLSLANLSLANLYGTSLSGANLSLASLRGANLSLADLSGANLYGTSLSGANLYEATLGDTIVVQSGPLGSRRDYLVTVWQPGWEHEETRAGCWTGTLAELAERVTNVYGDTRYGQEYRATIAYHQAMLAARRTGEGSVSDKKATN